MADDLVPVSRSWLLGVLDDAMGWREPQYGGGCTTADGQPCSRETPCLDHAADQATYDQYHETWKELRA